MVDVDDSCTPRRTPSLGQLCPEHRHFNSADGVLNPLSQTWPSDVGLQSLDAFVGRCSPSVHRGRTNPGPWLPPLPPFSTPHAHQACLDRGSVKTGPQVAGRGGHTLRRRRCRLSSYARLWPTYSGTATSYQPLETLLSQFICSSRSLMSDGQRAQRDGMETIKLDSKRNLSKKPAFARGYRADSHRDTITEAPICPRPQPYTVDAHTIIIRGAGVISQPCHSRPSCSNPKASCKKQAPSHCHIYTVGVGQQPMLS